MRRYLFFVWAGALVLGAAGPAHGQQAERRIDPTFLHRNISQLTDAALDIAATGCHYRPIFGKGGKEPAAASGVARFAQVIVDAHGACKTISAVAEDRIYLVLKGQGAMTYAGQDVPLAAEDFLYVPAGVSHTLRNDGAAPLDVIVMGYRTRGFPAGALPAHPLKDNIANVPLEHVGSHPASAHYRLLLGDDSQTRDRIDVGKVVTSLFVMEIDRGGTNFPHHHPREEEIYLVLNGHGTQVAGSGLDGIAGRFPAGVGDAWYYRPNTTVGYYSAADVPSRILCIRSWQPGLEPGTPRK